MQWSPLVAFGTFLTAEELDKPYKTKDDIRKLANSDFAWETQFFYD